jgi:N-acetylneuraminate synthase
MRTFDVAGRMIGQGHPCFIIAEAGVNHNGSLEMARKLVDVAKEAGADAVKFQTFKAERLTTTDAPKAQYQQQSTDRAESQYEMLRRLELSYEAHRDLMAYCRARGILFLSSPFDEESVDFLDELGLVAFKIPSGEITNLPFLAHVAHKGKPMIVSTGMSYLGEVETAIRTIVEEGNQKLVLLHCISNYPAPAAEANLRAMNTMAMAFGFPMGYSDHTLGIEVSLAAVALGACVIEKHFTLDHTLSGPDHRASLEPGQLKALVEGIHAVEVALGHGRKEPSASEVNTAVAARKSLVAARDLQAGTLLFREAIRAKRPAGGLSPALLPLILGRRLKHDLVANQPIHLEDIE